MWTAVNSWWELSKLSTAVKKCQSRRQKVKAAKSFNCFTDALNPGPTQSAVDLTLPLAKLILETKLYCFLDPEPG